MSIFGRRDNAGSAPAGPGEPEGAAASSSSQRPQQRRITHIAPGSLFKGEISGSTELLVEGSVEGEIRLDAPLMIGTDGVVQGPVSARVVRIGGRVVGSVTAADRVEVAPTGSMEGDICAPRIVIAEGAFFKGKVEMTGEKAEQARRPPKAEPPRNSPTGQQPKPSAEPGKP